MSRLFAFTFHWAQRAQGHIHSAVEKGSELANKPGGGTQSKVSPAERLGLRRGSRHRAQPWPTVMRSLPVASTAQGLVGIACATYLPKASSQPVNNTEKKLGCLLCPQSTPPGCSVAGTSDQFIAQEGVC